MDSLQEGHYDDLMRAFFRLKVGDIGELISQIGDVTAVAAQDTGLSLVELLPDANRIVLVCLALHFLTTHNMVHRQSLNPLLTTGNTILVSMVLSFL